MELQNLSAQEIKSFLSKSNGSVVLWGAGDLGEIIKYAFETTGIKVDFFCDSDENKQNKTKGYYIIFISGNNNIFDRVWKKLY